MSMTSLDIYDFFGRHKRSLWISLSVITVVLAGLALTLRFSENINDFLPLGTSHRRNLSVYQNISGADRLIVLFSGVEDPDVISEAIEAFEENVHQTDTSGWCESLSSLFDVNTIQEVSGFVYDNIPYFLTPSDYARMDSLLSDPAYIPEQLARDREMLMFPSGGMLTGSISKDPLGLFAPVLSKLQAANGQMNFEMYGGHIFTPDMSRAIAMMTSPFGGSETENNAKLLKLLDEAEETTKVAFPDVNIDVIGGPAIAVGNSSRIKKDSFIAISLSVILIALLLLYSFHSFRNIFLIILSIGWGALFALGGMSLFRDEVSVIVIGISSVILGIAVNYPLHLIAHTAHQPDKRKTLSEIATPLIVGNITTVGAFLSLIPLKAAALKDLGIFASLLLVGTILFVLVYLPHFIRVRESSAKKNTFIDYLSGICPENSRVTVILVVVITLFLGYFSFGTGFDSNIANINYMTPEQRDDMQYFENLLTNNESHTARSVYVLSEGDTYDGALAANALIDKKIDSLCKIGSATRQQEVSQFFVSEADQRKRLDMWRDFVERHKSELTETLDRESAACGFSPKAFAGFKMIVASSENLGTKDLRYFSTLTESIFYQNFTELEDGKSYVVNVLNVEPENIQAVEDCFDDSFDVAGMNGALSNTLSDNFNYIGWACSLIVFFFLWYSFGNLELALISFLPMAISWVWILGLMTLLGIKFNIVNVILATFIFGQGDDYTIFMTEGCQYEYAYRKPILSSYKSSILQSAVIMFVGMGTLIVARHPAMRSLAEVTIIGMLSVVLMAYTVPPLLFKWLTTKNGTTRRTPLSIMNILRGESRDPESVVSGRYKYKGKAITSSASRNLRRRGQEIINMQLSGVSEQAFSDDGYGELGILLALTHPDVKVIVKMKDSDRARIAEVSAEGLTDNIEFKL